ncbi:MAG: hypothetical protein LBQ73_10470 [Tannerellaceae bacterium]|jgi:hypothetical protein|nr:hypothetical protein [Tannerellaceae bacterium]
MKHNTILYIFPLLALLGACEVHNVSDSSNAGESMGQGGSMARFTVAGDYLYTVDHNTLKTFDVSNAEAPEYLEGKEQYMDFGVETIFSMDTLLFLGSQTGMYIFNITRPAFPQQMANVSHITSCDPVVASGRYAYVTLNSENYWCGRSVNELHVYDLTDLYNPILIRRETALKHPKGLGIDGNKLFICDNGLKVYDVTDPAHPLWIDDITDIPQAAGIDAYDVIPLNGVLLLVGADGFYQFDYSGDKLSFLSKIEVSPEE